MWWIENWESNRHCLDWPQLARHVLWQCQANFYVRCAWIPTTATCESCQAFGQRARRWGHRLATLEALTAFRKKKGEQTGNCGNCGNCLWVQVEFVGLDQGQGPHDPNPPDPVKGSQPYLLVMVMVCTDMIWHDNVYDTNYIHFWNAVTYWYSSIVSSIQIGHFLVHPMLQLRSLGPEARIYIYICHICIHIYLYIICDTCM